MRRCKKSSASAVAFQKRLLGYLLILFVCACRCVCVCVLQWRREVDCHFHTLQFCDVNEITEGKRLDYLYLSKLKQLWYHSQPNCQAVKWEEQLHAKRWVRFERLLTNFLWPWHTVHYNTHTHRWKHAYVPPKLSPLNRSCTCNYLPDRFMIRSTLLRWYSGHTNMLQTEDTC